jgi:hypothetical protein
MSEAEQAFGLWQCLQSLSAALWDCYAEEFTDMVNADVKDNLPCCWCRREASDTDALLPF